MQVLYDSTPRILHQPLHNVQGFRCRLRGLGHGRHLRRLKIMDRVLRNTRAHGLCRSLIFLASLLVRGRIK